MRNTAIAILAVAALPLAACGESQTPRDYEEDEAVAEAEFEWPESVDATDVGFPSDNSECRRLNDSPNTTEFQSDDAVLVGCPDAVTAAALGGAIVGDMDGVTMVSIPNDEVEALMQRVDQADGGMPDAVDADASGVDPVGEGMSDATNAE